MNNKKIILISAILILIAVGGGFYGGMKYAGSKNLPKNFQANGTNFQGMRQGSGVRTGAGGGLVSGEILKKDDKSITIKLRDGGSKIVYISDSTSISKSTDGFKNDLEIGKNVMVNGSAGQDGSVVAQNIQIRPVQLTP